MIERLPEKARTRSVAEAVTSPSGILLAGAAAAAAIAFAPVWPITAPIAAVAAWAARVAMAVPRTPKGERVDPARLRDPWRHFVVDAQQAKTKFTNSVARARPGPMQDRLNDLGRRIDQAVSECWAIACQGDALEEALGQIDPRSVHAELRQVEADRSRARDEATVQALDRTAAALGAQLASAERLAAVARDASNRLRVLNAQLDEAVARAVELTLRTTDAGALSPLTEDVDSLVAEMESLRQALEETHAVSPGTPGTNAPGTA